MFQSQSKSGSQDQFEPINFSRVEAKAIYLDIGSAVDEDNMEEYEFDLVWNP